MTNSPERIGVLIANTGSPKSPAPRDVRAYLGRFLMDARIRPMNKQAWWLILHLCILPKRGRVSGAKYGKIWTPQGSPFDVEHAKLRGLLEGELRDAGFDARVAVGQSYGFPTIAEAVGKLRNAGCTRLIALPLYPQSAFSTTLSVKDSVEAALAACGWSVPWSLVESYGKDPVYLDAIAACVRAAGFGDQPGDRLLFNYHSIPLVDIEAGDTYEVQTGATALAIASRLGLERTQWTVGYNCQFDKGREWLQPFTRSILERWAHAKPGRVFMVCPNFAVDCLETLYDIDYELRPYYREQLADAGKVLAGNELVYVPCLNGTTAHAAALAHVLASFIDGKEQKEHHE